MANVVGRSAALVCALLVGGCLESGVTVCADGRICPAEQRCDEIHDLCVLPDQLTTCIGHDDLERCQVGGEPDVGLCVDEICLVEGCGDTLITGNEDCDGDTWPEGVSGCLGLGYYTDGEVRCTTNCTWDTSDC